MKNFSAFGSEKVSLATLRSIKVWRTDESLLKLAGQKRLAASLGRQVKSEERKLMSTLTSELVTSDLHDPKSRQLLED